MGQIFYLWQKSFFCFFGEKGGGNSGFWSLDGSHSLDAVAAVTLSCIQPPKSRDGAFFLVLFLPREMASWRRRKFTDVRSSSAEMDRGEEERRWGKDSERGVGFPKKVYINTTKKVYINTFFARKMTLRKVFMDVAKYISIFWQIGEFRQTGLSYFFADSLPPSPHPPFWWTNPITLPLLLLSLLFQVSTARQPLPSFS